MTSQEQIEISADEVMRLARARVGALLMQLAPQIPAETQSLLSEETDNFLRLFEENLRTLLGTRDDEIISTSDAAKLRFVSRPHVVELIEEGKLPLHHMTGQNRFVRKADVLDYRTKKQVDAKAFFEAQIENDSPDGL
jgi:excisionase family DNA binding protein